MKPGDIITIAGQRYRVLSESQGPFVRLDGKVIEGVRYARVVPA